MLDYVEPGNWAEAEKTAQQIVKLGFMPWVANGDLTWLGQGRLRLAPRKLLAIVNGTPAQQMDQELFRHAAMPLEYLGLALDYWYIDQLSFAHRAARRPLCWRDRMAEWRHTRDGTGRYESVCARLKTEVDAGLPVVFMGHLPAALPAGI